MHHSLSVHLLSDASNNLYPIFLFSIDNDILNLMDELDFDLLFKELTDSLGDSDKFMVYITERCAVLVERFLDYLPRMSIPIEKRELQDGWVLTCRSKDGGDLRLSDISVKRENLMCQVVGSDNVFQPILGKDDYIGTPTNLQCPTFDSDVVVGDEEEESVLEEVRELILIAQRHGDWVTGVGGVQAPSQFNGVPYPLHDLPLTQTLKTGIDLWQSSAISDFEFIQIAIRDVSSQIQRQKEYEEKNGKINVVPVSLPKEKMQQPIHHHPKRFNPRLDPTLLFLDIKNLTLHLDEFTFRVEKGENRTIFDPVFEGSGSLTVQNVSITLRVEVKKERVNKHGFKAERPVLQLTKFDVRLEKLKLVFKETGADWILNSVLKGFRDQITEIVQDNLKEQISQQVHIILDQANGLIYNNPDLLMQILGVTVNNLEESIICV